MADVKGLPERAASQASSFVSVEPEVSPFWKQKKNVYRKIKDERAVVVLVKSDENLGDMKNPSKLLMQGAGHIRASRGFAFNVAKNFEDLPKVSSTIQVAKFDTHRNMLHLVTSALGYEAQMWLQVDLRESEKGSDIRFVIRRGVFTGMTGVVRFSEVGRKNTEVSLVADYRYKELPVPKFFVSFGLEVVLQRVAIKMRSYIEDRYKEATST